MTALLLVFLAALEVPPLRGHVADRAGVLDAQQRAALERQLTEYRQSTGHEFAVLILPSLEDEDLEQYGLRVAETWQLGKRGRDDGLLLLVALADRRVRVEAGYGLEGVITDALSSRVIRDVIAPAFQRQDFAGGISQGLAVLMRAAAGEAAVPEPIATQPSAPRPRLSFGTIVFLLFLFFMLLRPRRSLPAMLLGSMIGSTLGGRRGGFGGGGGGFYKGGGGRFGGGGASGGW